MRSCQISRGNTYGEALLDASAAPTQTGVVPVLNFWGSFLFMRTPFVSELSNLTW